MNKTVSLLILLSFGFSCGAVAQNRQLESLLQQLPAAKADTNAVRLYIDIGEQYGNTGDLKNAGEYHLKAIALSQNLNYLKGVYEASDEYSFLLIQQRLYDSAIVVNKRVMELALKQADYMQVADEKVYIGDGYNFKGYYETTLAYFTEALTFFEQAGLQNEMALLYMRIHNLYARMDRYEDALAYGEKAMPLYHDTLAVEYGYALLSLSVSYYSIRPPQDEKALAFLQKTLFIAGRTGNAVLEATAYNYMANIHFNRFRIDESEACYRKALDFFKEETFPDDFCVANIGLAKIAMFRNDFIQAEARGLKNLELSRRRGLRAEERNALSFLWELSAARHDYIARNRYKMAVDSMQQIYVNEAKLRAVEELGIQYETEKKEIRIFSLEAEKRLMTWLSIAGGGLLLSGLVALFFRWRWTVQKHRIAEQQKQLAEQQIIQLEQEKQLVATQAVFDGEVQERTRLARDLHDGMGGKLTAMKIHLQELKRSNNFDDAEFNRAMDMLDDSVQEMRRVSHNLMPDSLSRTGLKQAIDDFCRSMSPRIIFNYYGEETRLDLKLETLIYRCVSELVNNAMKYAAASHIMVQIIQETGSIAFTVQDNGCGFDPSAETEGIGLKNVCSRVASLGGDIQIDSKAGVGTEINAEFKIVVNG